MSQNFLFQAINITEVVLYTFETGKQPCFHEAVTLPLQLHIIISENILTELKTLPC